MSVNANCAKRNERSWRSPDSIAWIEIFFVLCIIGAAIELFWGMEIHDWLSGGRVSHERSEIITSYYQQAQSGIVPKPADSKSIEVRHADEKSHRMTLRIRTQTGETQRYEAVPIMSGSVTNWLFR